MMSDYVWIARAYVCRTSAVVWCFLLVCLVSVSAMDGSAAFHHPGPLGSLLSRKSYLAMFAYFNAVLLGVVVRDSIAHPWATVLPRYRSKHLLVFAFLTAICIGIPMVLTQLVGGSEIATSSVVAIFLSCVAAGLWTLQHPALGFLAFPFLAFVMMPASSAWLAPFLIGSNSVVTAAVMLVSLLVLVGFLWRLNSMEEGTLEYVMARVWGNVFRRRGQTLWDQSMSIGGNSAPFETVGRTSIQTCSTPSYPFSNLGAIDNLSEYTQRSLFQRMELWRIATTPTPTSISVFWLVFVSFILVAMMVCFRPLMNEKVSHKDTVLIFAVQIMTNPFSVWFFWFARRPRFGYESLRPRTRPQFVKELGLAMLQDSIKFWLGGVIFFGLASVIWVPELLDVRGIVLFVLGTLVCQLIAFAWLGAALCEMRGTLKNMVGAFLPFPVIALCIPWLLNSRFGTESELLMLVVGVGTGISAVAIVYRRACAVDLG